MLYENSYGNTITKFYIILRAELRSYVGEGYTLHLFDVFVEFVIQNFEMTLNLAEYSRNLRVILKVNEYLQKIFCNKEYIILPEKNYILYRIYKICY